MTTDIEVMEPLYPSEGGSVCGYVCCDRSNGRICKRVTRTKRGMWTHLRITHQVKPQSELPFETLPGKNSLAGDTLQVIR